VPSELALPNYTGVLGDGLVRRWSTAADTEKFARLMGIVFREERDELPNPRPMAEARLMMQPVFPYMTPEDIAVVEDTSAPERPLVACTTFWRDRWSYAGIPFGVTRPEMVATDPAFRRRGLVRALFEMIHARSAAEGHLLQAITGIPFFYRQFDYEYALDLEGGRTTYFSLIPAANAGDLEPCSLRVATLADVEHIVDIYNQRRAGSLVWHEAPEGYWRYRIAAWDDPRVRDQDARRIGINGRYWMILNAEREVCGYVLVATRRWGRALAIHELGFAPNQDLSRILPALLRRLRDLGLQAPAVRPDIPACTEIGFNLGRSHPLYDLLGDAQAPRIEAPYAWYVRIPDVPAFLHHIAPALEARLAQSLLAGFSGSLKIDLYRERRELYFDHGKLIKIEPWQPSLYDDDSAALGCPPLTFLQLLLGYRGLDELCAIFPDVRAKDDQRHLINTLFPKLPSYVDPLG
jgi:hypothetical protein